MLYEGTTGIQALDLLGRKVLMSQGESLKVFTKIVHQFCKAHADDAAMQPFVEPLARVNREWGELTLKIGMAAMQDRNEVGAASVDYLMYSGYVVLAYFWARSAQVAQQALHNGTDEEAFYRAKLATANFYYKRILPRTRSLSETMVAGAESLMDLDQDSFSF
jgi:hypothetical protein